MYQRDTSTAAQRGRIERVCKIPAEGGDDMKHLKGLTSTGPAEGQIFEDIKDMVEEIIEKIDIFGLSDIFEDWL
jgi:hypothetical protein